MTESERIIAGWAYHYERLGLSLNGSWLLQGWADRCFVKADACYDALAALSQTGSVSVSQQEQADSPRRSAAQTSD